ncbi:MAG: PQQ-binding-like beta-propeller repeat protein [Melioribacteraceae bacterium]|nr:PQQ-binding-like beta-propeller repeat protein [Melioribacteraceae bacterium]
MTYSFFKLFVTFFALLAINSQAQNFKFAWISSPEAGIENNDSKLDSVINAINKNTDLKFTIINGNLTSSGRSEEFYTASEIFQTLEKPYYIIPGRKDIEYSESGFSSFLDLWKKDKFLFEQDSTLFIGLNSSIPLGNGCRHYKVEDLIWLKSKLDSLKTKSEIFLITNKSIENEPDNNPVLMNIFRDYNLRVVFISNKQDNEIKKVHSIHEINSLPVFSKNKPAWNLKIIENKKDSIIVNQQVNIDSVITLKKIKKNQTHSIPDFDQKKFIDKSVSFMLDTSTNRTLLHEPVIYNSNIYTSSLSGIITCMDSSGTVLWDYNTFGNIVGKPVITENIIAVGTTQGDLLTLNAAKGTLLQSIGFDEAITSQLITIEYKGKHEFLEEKVSGNNTAVILGTYSGNLYCYDFETLEELWVNNSVNGMIETKPIQIGNKIIFGAWDGYLYAVDAKEGWLIWKWKNDKDKSNSPASVIPVTDGNSVFISTPDKFITAIDARLGKTLWKTDKYDALNSIGISTDKKKLFIKSDKDKFYVIHSKNGKFIKQINVNYGIDRSSNNIQEINNIIPFGADNGNIYRINNRYYFKTLLFMGNSRIHTVQKFNDMYLLASNLDGRIIIFKID